MRPAMIALLLITLLLSGCGSCTPAAAYTVPAHWDQAYYSQDEQLSYYRPYRSCSGYYSNGYYHRSCSTSYEPVYRWVPVYHQAVYHPVQHVAAVVCGKSS